MPHRCICRQSNITLLLDTSTKGSRKRSDPSKTCNTSFAASLPCVEELCRLPQRCRTHEVETTRELILAELEEARQIAKKARNGSAMAMASLGKAKVLGLIIDRREIGDVGAFDNMTDEELVEQAKKRASALGLPAPSIN